jgi:hypothetical protein
VGEVRLELEPHRGKEARIDLSTAGAVPQQTFHADYHLI